MLAHAEPAVGYNQRSLWMLGGIVGPLVCVGVELATRFDPDLGSGYPLPTHLPILPALTVPLATLLGLRTVDRPALRRDWHAVLFGCALASSFGYALVLAPLLPLALFFVLYLIPLLALAPLFAFLALFQLLVEFNSRPGRLSLAHLAAGATAGALAFGLLFWGR